MLLSVAYSRQALHLNLLHPCLGEGISQGDGAQSEVAAVFYIGVEWVGYGYSVVAVNAPHLTLCMLIGVELSQTSQVCCFLTGERIDQGIPVSHGSQCVLVGQIGAYISLGVHVEHVATHREVHEDIQIKAFVAERVAQTTGKIRVGIAYHGSVIGAPHGIAFGICLSAVHTYFTSPGLTALLVRPFREGTPSFKVYEPSAFCVKSSVV